MIFTFLISLLSTHAVDLVEIRDLFTRADKEEKSCEKLLELTDGYTIDYKPVVYAYHAAAEMTMANHSTWPGTKLKYFNSGKIKLESVVRKNMNDIEIRFIRFAVQFGSPSFLDYKGDLENDKSFIKRNLNDAQLPPGFKKTIKATIEQ